MTGVSYATSAEMAEELGAFPRYADNRDAMLRVIGNHRLAAHGKADGYDGLSIPPVPLDHQICPQTDLTRQLRRLGPGSTTSVASTVTATPRPALSRRPAQSAW